MKKINTQGLQIYTFNQNKNDYISLTDIARYKDKERTDHIVQNWMRTRDVIEFLGIWEQIYNPNFKPIEFERFKSFNVTEFCNIKNEVGTNGYFSKRQIVKTKPNRHYSNEITFR